MLFFFILFFRFYKYLDNTWMFQPSQATHYLMNMQQFSIEETALDILIVSLAPTNSKSEEVNCYMIASYKSGGDTRYDLRWLEHSVWPY